MTAVPAADLPDGIVLLDGGMGQELGRRGVAGFDQLWSAAALVHDPGLVQAVHADYIRAGARVITTNSYSTTRRGLERAGQGERFAELNRLAGELACRARDDAGAEVLIAGSLPPLRGSYRPDQVEPFAVIEPAYRELAELLAPYVDLFVCETMSSGAEAQAAASAAAATGKPVWVAWTLEDGGSSRLRSGESIADAAALLADLPVSAFLANCCAPESVTAAMPVLTALGPWPVGGFANAFRAIPHGWSSREHGLAALGQREDLTPESYAGHARDWIDAGARIVGGCCEVGPAHIAAIKAMLDARD